MKNNSVSPPEAKKIPHELHAHGETRIDNYYWMREKTNPEVRAYLEAENVYAAAQLQSSQELQRILFAEFKSRIKETDTTAPVKNGAYWYYQRTEAGKQYNIICRKNETLEALEEVILDVNALADGHEFFSLGSYQMSPDHKRVAYAVNTDGSEHYTLLIKDIASRTLLSEQILDTYYGIEWAADSSSLYYVTTDEIHRADSVFCHVLGTPVSEDVRIYHETDKRFGVAIKKTSSKKFIVITSRSKESSESYVVAADAAKEIVVPRLIHPREPNHLYRVDHSNDLFYILTNVSAPNYTLVTASEENGSRSNWIELIPHRSDVELTELKLFQNHLVYFEMREGVEQIHIQNLITHETREVVFDEPCYTIALEQNPEFETDILRYTYSSLITPRVTVAYSMSTGEREVLKTEEIGDGFDTNDYVTTRAYATAADGTKIPLSLAYKKNLERTGNNPCWLYGYGAYGAVIHPHFQQSYMSLLGRGFVVAIAHVRGGGECGRAWYEGGKYLKKTHTFTDFIACAEFLVTERYTAPAHLIGVGRSAGGLLIGAVANMRHDLFAALIADVPFVDVLTTMLDPTIPLTVEEYEEWGNPELLEYYQYMRSYSPYDGVAARAYPHMLVQAGFNDTRVFYWEPAKWVAKLRALKTDKNDLFCITDMGAGHAGASGRYSALQEVAREYAFAITHIT